MSRSIESILTDAELSDGTRESLDLRRLLATEPQLVSLHISETSLWLPTGYPHYSPSRPLLPPPPSQQQQQQQQQLVKHKSLVLAPAWTKARLTAAPCCLECFVVSDNRYSRRSDTTGHDCDHRGTKINRSTSTNTTDTTTTTFSVGISVSISTSVVSISSFDGVRTMTEPYQRTDGRLAEPPKQKDDTTAADNDTSSLDASSSVSCRRESRSEHHNVQHHLDNTQKASGAVPPQLLTSNTQSPQHKSPPALSITTDISPSPSNRSSLQVQPAYAAADRTMPSINSGSNPTTEQPQDASPIFLSDDALDMDRRTAYEKCPLECPVNKQSVAELETHRIVNNPKLRNDANYDADLHFRQNLDGQFGKQKVRDYKAYWLAVDYELELVESILRRRADPSAVNDDAQLREELAACKKRLPYVFTAVKDILTSLVPETEQGRINERLDVPFLMQQIDNGVCDLVDLANWLAKIITTHCAPMRDAQVAKMVKTVVDATANAETAQLTDGLRQLVDIMEAMKLDVANHQIRHIRSQLIAGTVLFQKRYNNHRMTHGKLNIDASREWLQEEIVRLRKFPGKSTMLDALCSAILDDMALGCETFAPTFYLDHERLRGLAGEMHSHLCREICHEVLANLISFQSMEKAWEMLEIFLATITGPAHRFADNINNIAVQISRIITSCIRGSEQLDTSIILEATERLNDDLCQQSVTYGRHRLALLSRLIPKLRKSVQSHVSLTPLELQDALVSTTPRPTSHQACGFGAVLEPVRKAKPYDPDHTLIKKLTHILVIHWQVWSDEYQAVQEAVDAASPTSDPEINLQDIASPLDDLFDSALPVQSFAQETAP